ncbi:MAG: DUF2079 domain-containing protein [Ruminococcus sp.]|nr:DUF2079 domain-containing protein [Ruminococcus sp.]
MKEKEKTGVQKLAYYTNKGYSHLCEHCLSPDRIVAALLASFMLAYIFQLFAHANFYELENYYNSINFGVFFFLAGVMFLVLTITSYKTLIKSLIPRALFVLTLFLSAQFAMLNNETDVYFVLGIALIDFIIISWLVKEDKLEISGIKITPRVCLIAAVALFVVTSIAYGYITSMRYIGYQCSTFDFGIFSNMFEHMAQTGLPNTTVEREGLTSHFGVHFSPFFYLLLPGYMLFRSPFYLYYTQSIFVAAGVFAVYLISRKLEFSGRLTLALEFIYAFYPSLFLGCFYDFHENKFLTVIILFLFYFILSNKTTWTIVFSLLLLSVKEDAAIYLIAISLFVMVYMKKVAKGAIMLAMSIVYFIIAQRVVSALGDGVMMWRLSDYFLGEEKNFAAVAKSIIYDFGFLLKQMFIADKIPFIIWILLPVACTPFMTKKISSYLLLIPIIPINLMQSWVYQYDISFQYTYGTAALVIMSAIFVIGQLKDKRKRTAVLMSICMCLVMSSALIWPKMRNNFAYAKNVKETGPQVQQVLDTIPSDVSVTAAHRIMPHLSHILDLTTASKNNTNLTQTDYYVLDTRDEETSSIMRSVMQGNYVLVTSGGFVELYKRNY